MQNYGIYSFEKYILNAIFVLFITANIYCKKERIFNYSCTIFRTSLPLINKFKKIISSCVIATHRIILVSLSLFSLITIFFRVIDLFYVS